MHDRVEAPQWSRRGKSVDHNLSSLNIKNFSYTLVTPPLELAVDDSGYTSHFFPTTRPCDNKVPALYGGKLVCMPNGEIMVAMHTALLSFPKPTLES